MMWQYKALFFIYLQWATTTISRSRPADFRRQASHT
ncbi:unnamed protein product [Linum tenue]|uniref:Uncharacterized protein n=1 Tax=Linum tenue TaxID=586396 RepID=A0AAV0N3U1_9ROSI|nr:unnamed protein product [Linum tenue]